jgi:uncharacterized protein YndB with AHSA1/START domain
MSAVNIAEREIVISRVFNAPRELVWEAMADPKHIVNWWGPNGFTTTIEIMEFRVGGVWKHMMIDPDGTEYPNKSIFTAIVKPELIEYAHVKVNEDDNGAKCDATWIFEAISTNQTKLTMQLRFPHVEVHDMPSIRHVVTEGGKQTMARLADFLERKTT